jgi:hypothetical protein
MVILAHPTSSLECYFKIDFNLNFHITHVFQNSTFNFLKLEKKCDFFHQTNGNFLLLNSEFDQLFWKKF